MGYSCTVLAAFARDEMIKQLKAASDQDVNTSNGWRAKGKEYFMDCSREQDDGAVTAPVFEIRGEFCHRSGGIRIEPDGVVTRFPTSTATMRKNAHAAALAEYKRRYGVEYPKCPPVVGGLVCSVA